jgi:UrcA family protein
MFTRRSSHFVCATLLSLGVAAGAAPAFAQEPAAVAVTVRYTDLDLSGRDGVEALYKRLTAASRQVCHAYASRQLERQIRWRTCYQTALDGAIEAIDLATLTVLHRESAIIPRYPSING